MSDEDKMIEIILQDLDGKEITRQRAMHLAVRLRDEGFYRFPKVKDGLEKALEIAYLEGECNGAMKMGYTFKDWQSTSAHYRAVSMTIPTPDTSKIDTPAEVGEMAKKRFDELTTGDDPYPFEWRSFYNGYLEGAFRRREESTPGEVRTGGLAEHGPQTEADHLPDGGELSGLPVEDQIRLYLRSGGSMAGAEALRAKLTHSPLSTKEIV